MLPNVIEIEHHRQPRLSQDYLERIEREQVTGRPAEAQFLEKTVTTVGAGPTRSYVLHDISLRDIHQHP
jgi:hypothetical protein